MPTNDFLPFGLDPSANVMSQADWLALGARIDGFASGIAHSDQLNKAWRQSAFMAYLMAQFTVDSTGLDLLDDANTAGALAKLKAAHRGRLINVQVFTASGTYTPTAGTAFIIVEAVGGGGGGGGVPISGSGNAAAGTPGGGATYGKARINSGFTPTVAVTIGAGGSGGAGVNGGDGGATSFGGFLVCPGGPGGTAGLAQAGSASGGTGISSGAPTGTPGANIHSAIGSSGGVSFGFTTGQVKIGASGGDSTMGMGGPGQSANNTGQAARGPGGGGGGVIGIENSSALTGGAGAAGKVIVYEYA